MKIAVDTNILVRVATGDDPKQARAAEAALSAATLVVIGTQALCELCWVLAQRYNVAPADIAAQIRALIDAETVVVDRRAVNAGLALLEAGGDFADGVIAHEGFEMGADTFVSFDKKAVARLKAHGMAARLLA